MPNPFQLLNRLRNRVSALFRCSSSDSISRRRRELSDHLFDLFEGRIRYGPFSGLKLLPQVSWPTTHRASALLGIYEKEVLNSLCDVPATHSVFVDIGSSDGYYGVGVLFSNLFDKSYCFETSELGQKIIAKNARVNGVSSRVKVYGRAEREFYRDLADDDVDLSKAVVLCDIEGGEFSIFDKAAFEALRGSIIFIELHDMFFDNGAELLQQLMANARAHFTITELRTSSRDLSTFGELKSFSDTDRWLICSEGRPALMSWLRLDPIQ